MKSKYVYATLLAATLSSTACAEPAKSSTAAGEAIDASRCTACHQGGLSLSKYSADDLTQRIITLRDNPASHPPLMLEQAGEDDISRLAAALASEK
jgi:mono/diheme cytochrome c family protein